MSPLIILPCLLVILLPYHHHAWLSSCLIIIIIIIIIIFIFWNYRCFCLWFQVMATMQDAMSLIQVSQHVPPSSLLCQYCLP